MAFTVARAIRNGFAFAFLVILAGGLASLFSTIRLMQTADTVRHGDEVEEQLEHVRIQADETGVRGFALTGDRRFLLAHQDAPGRLDAAVAALRRLTSDNRAQQQRLDELEPLLAKRQALNEELIEVREKSGLAAAAARVAAGESEATMIRIRQLLTAMEEAEDRVVASRLQADAAMTHRLLGVHAGVLLLALSLMAVAFLLVRRRISRPVASLADGVERLSAGDLGARVDARGQDEFSRLARSFNEMAEKRQRAEEALAASERRLAHELRFATDLRRITERFMREGDLSVDLSALRGEVVDAAILVTHADFGHLRLFDPGSQRLNLVAQRGFTQTWLDFMTSVDKDQAVSGTPLTVGQRLILEEIASDPLVAGQPQQLAALREGVHALQATPLIGRSGKLVGMLSTHYRAPTRPDERDLALLDVLAAQVAQMLERSELDARLLASEGRLRELFESTPDGIFITGRDGRFTDVNRAACRMLGYSREELLGLSMADVTPPADVPRQAAVMQRLREGGKDVSEWRLRGKDGTIAWAELSLNALADGHTQAIARDLTERRAAEEALRISEAKYSGIVSMSADAIICIDANQRITLFNRGAEQIFGYPRDEALGAPLDLLLPERFRHVHGQHVRNFCGLPAMARRMGEGSAEICGRRRNGEEFPAEAAISKIDLGGTALTTVALRDVTDRKRIENEQRFLARAGVELAGTLDLEATLAAIGRLALPDLADCCSVDLPGDSSAPSTRRVFHVDPTRAEACRQLQAARPDWGPARVVLQSRRPSVENDLDDKCLARLTSDDEHLVMLRELAPRACMSVPLLVRGRLLGALTLLTSRPGRRYDALTVALAEALAVRAASAIDNACLYETAQRATRARDNVLGIVAHDLRTPLNGIILHAELLQRLCKEVPAPAHQAIIGIQRGSQRMNRLIRDMLDVARLDTGRLAMQLERVSLTEVLADAAAAGASMASAASLDFHVDVEDLPEVRGDRERLCQVFDNLLGNAAKFTPPGGRITLGAGRRPTDILLWVADDGPGISADNLPHVFDRFWQGKKDDRRGLGLGLAITKEIVEGHGGRVWAESRPAEGSTFFFTLPTVPPLQEEASDQRPGTPGTL